MRKTVLMWPGPPPLLLPLAEPLPPVPELLPLLLPAPLPLLVPPLLPLLALPPLLVLLVPPVPPEVPPLEPLLEPPLPLPELVLPEPLPGDHPLRSMTNVVISAHVGAQSPEGRERHWRLFRENVRRFVAGERLLCVVDKAKGY